jgi:hypothetical protein
MKTLIILLVLINTCWSAGFVPLDPELAEFKYPFPVEYHPVDVKGQSYRMAYMDLKPEGGDQGRSHSSAWEKLLWELLGENGQ